MATTRIKRRGKLRISKEVEYAAAVKAAHDYQRQRKIMLDVVAAFEAVNGIDDERLKQETFERIKSFDDGSDKKKRKGRK